MGVIRHGRPSTGSISVVPACPPNVTLLELSPPKAVNQCIGEVRSQKIYDPLENTARIAEVREIPRSQLDLPPVGATTSVSERCPQDLGIDPLVTLAHPCPVEPIDVTKDAGGRHQFRQGLCLA
jgi:hypothetical protein